MSGVPETLGFTEEVYQLEETDFVEGGPDGPLNLAPQQLASRTRYLRDYIRRAVQTLVLTDDEGDAHHMVYIPRFRVPADAIATGIPAHDLLLGGFCIDKYPCSTRTFAGGAVKAVSRPLVAPEVTFTADEMASAVAKRRFGDVPCRMMGLREWGHLAWLVRLAGVELKGNLDDGRDPRDDDEWQNYGEPGYHAPALAGTGPLSWFHNELPNGLADLLGIPHALATSDIQTGVLGIVREATLIGAIDAVETDFVVEDPRALHPPEAGFAGWPTTNGLIVLEPDDIAKREFVVYGQLVPDPLNPARATLINCVRAQYSTSPDTHADGVACEQRAYHCIIPGGYAGFVDDGGLDNTSPGSATFAWTYGMWTHGSRDAAPAAGDVLCCGDEDLLVESVDGSEMTVTRGHNETAIAAHPAGYLFAAYSPTMTRAGQRRCVGYSDGVPRPHVDIEELYLPAVAVAQEPSGVRRRFHLPLRMMAARAAFMRGGHYGLGYATDMMDLAVPGAPDETYEELAFRAVIDMPTQFGGT
jgi:hypothetical protein